MNDVASRCTLPLMTIMLAPSTTLLRFSKSFGQTTTFKTPDSSSIVMNITPLADPYFGQFVMPYERIRRFSF